MSIHFKYIIVFSENSHQNPKEFYLNQKKYVIYSKLKIIKIKLKKKDLSIKIGLI